MGNARTKLNAAAINGALAIAGLVAALAQSWTAFTVFLVILVATAALSGDIRINGRRP